MISQTSVLKKIPNHISHDDIQTPNTPIHITPKKSRTSDMISKLNNVKRNSRKFGDEKPKWFHRKRGGKCFGHQYQK